MLEMRRQMIRCAASETSITSDTANRREESRLSRDTAFVRCSSIRPFRRVLRRSLSDTAISVLSFYVVGEEQSTGSWLSSACTTISTRSSALGLTLMFLIRTHKSVSCIAKFARQ